MTKHVHTARADDTLESVAKIMRRNNVGSVVIVDEQGKCAGILTERDFVRFLAENVPGTARVSEHMTLEPVAVNELATINEAKNIMATHRVRHLPVTDKDGRVVGMISVRDIYERMELFP